MANLACPGTSTPHPVRAEDRLEHPDELRDGLDPVPGVKSGLRCREVARVVRGRIDRSFGLVGWPKTSGSRGIHVNVQHRAAAGRFPQVRRSSPRTGARGRAAGAGVATAKWWKEERHGVFVDYNQNARDRTGRDAYPVRREPDARVSGRCRGMKSIPAIPRISPWQPCRLVSTQSAIGTRRSTSIHARSTHFSNCRHDTRRKALATRPGRRSTGNSPASHGEFSRLVRVRRTLRARLRLGRRIPKHPLIEIGSN